MARNKLGTAVMLINFSLLLSSCSATKDATSTATNGPASPPSPPSPTVTASPPEPSNSAGTDLRYKWKSPQDYPMQADGVTVKGDRRGNLKIGQAKDGAGMVPFVGNDVVIDTPGSRDVRIEIDPAVKKTTYAGLAFVTPCILEILEDTTLLANQEGIVAKDKKGKQWKTRKVTLMSKEVIAFFPG